MSKTNREIALDMAAEAFLERGFVSTSTESLTVNLNHAQIEELHRIGSKSKIAAAVVVHAFSGLPMLRNEDRPNPDADPLRRLAMLCRGVASSIVTNSAVHAAFRLIGEREFIDADLPKPLVTWLALIEELFDEVEDAGDTPTGLSPSDAAWMTVATFHGAKDACIILGQTDMLTGRVDTLLRMNLVGMGFSSEQVEEALA